jgi:peptidoglycan/xylan/chitin deacetylase (PgdA/CDA1 family)
VFGFSVPAGAIPVFVYHEVDAEAFAADLGFLRDNGYAALSIEEFLDRSRKQVPGKDVLITFDDARRNFWQAALPVIREFRTAVTLFAPTLWIGGSSENEGGAVAAAERRRFMTWPQLRECSDSGLVAVHPHGHRHGLVYVSSRLVGFACPDKLARYDVFDWPMRREGGRDLLGPPPLGTPVYRAAPLLSAPHRILEDYSVVEVCRELVQVEGGAAFFRRPDWEQRLRAVHERAAGARPAEVRMPEREFRSLVASEFALSVGAVREQLGSPADVFAYPWMLGTDTSVRLAQAAGIRAAFGVGLDFRRARRADLPVPLFGRLKADWLRRLPGRGRSSLATALGRKLVGFTGTQHLAH